MVQLLVSSSVMKGIGQDTLDGQLQTLTVQRQVGHSPDSVQNICPPIASGVLDDLEPMIKAWMPSLITTDSNCYWFWSGNLEF